MCRDILKMKQSQQDIRVADDDFHQKQCPYILDLTVKRLETATSAANQRVQKVVKRPVKQRAFEVLEDLERGIPIKLLKDRPQIVSPLVASSSKLKTKKVRQTNFGLRQQLLSHLHKRRSVGKSQLSSSVLKDGISFAKSGAVSSALYIKKIGAAVVTDELSLEQKIISQFR